MLIVHLILSSRFRIVGFIRVQSYLNKRGVTWPS